MVLKRRRPVFRRRKRRVFRKKLTMRKSIQYNVHKYKMRAQSDVITNVGGSLAYAFSMTKPDLWDQTNPLPEWASVLPLYDRYRVTGIKIKFIPDRPNDAFSATGFYPFYVAADYDDLGAPTSIQQMLDYDNCKILNLYKPWQLYYKIPRLMNPGQTGVITLGSGMMDVAATQSTGSIKMHFVGDLSKKYGTLIFTYYITLSNRR